MRNDYLPDDIPQRQATSKEAFVSRRTFVASAAATIGIIAGPGACAQEQSSTFETDENPAKLIPPIKRPDVFPPKRAALPPLPDGIEQTITPRIAAASHNNYYEFLYGRGGDVWPRTKDFVVDPWAIQISGECNKPITLDLDALYKFEHEERLYHFRCVERWAMNIPWSGFPLSKLLDRVEPNSDARYVRFVTANLPAQMPGLRSRPADPWPYQEAMRLDEAMNDLTMVVTGAYGEPLLKQHGAPIRIIVPWKYGYKNPKSIVRIELLKEKPATFWARLAPHEYGFISNINPNIPHPRWSQARSYWIDQRDKWFATPIFNGYGKYVADLYPDEPKTMQDPLVAGQIAR